MLVIKKYRLEKVLESSTKYDIETKKITSAETAYEICNKVLRLDKLTEEIFAVLMLDTKNQVLEVHEVSRGSLNASIVHPREVFKRVLLANANKIILTHNHPSGDPYPSEEDKKITKRLKDAGEILGIEVLDHIIVGEDRYYSFLEHAEL